MKTVYCQLTTNCQFTIGSTGQVYCQLDIYLSNWQLAIVSRL